MLDQLVLGAIIRNARMGKGWRPIDLALEMGWSGTAPVYRLERPGPGTPIPNPSTISQLAQILDLEYADRINLLGYAGHLPDTEELTAQEEAHLVELMRPIMDTANEPMVLYDFRERILAVNNPVVRSLGYDTHVVASWRENGITAFDLLWDAGHGFRSRFLNIDEVVQSQMLRFKLDNRLRRHEAWYRAYPACCAHYPGFVALWERTDAMLSGPHSDWDLSCLIPRTNEVIGSAGPILAYDSSRRLVHAGHGLVTLGIYLPRNDTPERRLASTVLE